MNGIQQSSLQRFTWKDTSQKIDKDSLLEIIKSYLTSEELKRLQSYSQYYQGMNTAMLKRYEDKRMRNKTPNHFLPTGYFSTIVDSMGGYLFNNVQYVNKDNEQYAEALNQILYDNDVEVKDMNTGTQALVYNKGIELVYTVGNESQTEIKFAGIDPRQMIVIYTEDIEPDVYAGIYIIKSPVKDYDYYVDVIYADQWQYWTMKDNEIAEREPDRPLFFSECPVVVYNTEIINVNSSFHTILPYIDALDFLLSGNSNEIDRLVDAMLVLGKIVKDEDLQHMEEWKLLEGMKTEDRAEYITKDMSPAFREYVSKLLINEIHKHSHVLDWYSPDSGMTGEVSGKALVTRLFDMQLFSERIEKVYRKGLWKRINLITELMAMKNMPIGEIDIKLNRTLPNMMIDTAQGLKDIPFISDETKRELCGIDNSKEEERLEKQAETVDITSILQPQKETPVEDEPVEEEESDDNI